MSKTDDFSRVYAEGEEAIKSLGETGDPKKEAGSAKPSMNNVSPVAEFYEGAVMDGGAITYGEYNWGEHSMEAKTYYNAIRRHLAQWWLGEDLDEKSGLPHLAHIRACCGILIDQQERVAMIDNRPKNLASLQKAFDVIGEAKTK